MINSWTSMIRLYWKVPPYWSTIQFSLLRLACIYTCQGRSTPYIGDGHPTFYMESWIFTRWWFQPIWKISADPSALPEGEAQGKRETVHSLQLQLPGLLEGLKMFPRPKPRPILPRLGCARFLIYVSSLYWSGLCAGALFFFVGGSKGGVLAPPNVRFCVVPELGFRWCLAVSHALPRSCVFGFSRLGCAMFFVYVLGLWGSFLLLRGFQRCRSGPAAGPVFCCAGARF